MKITRSIALLSTFAASFAPSLRAQQEGPVPTTALVQIESKGKPVDASMLTLQLHGKQVPIDSLTPIAPRGVEIAILIDNGLRQSASLQFRDMNKFIDSLPPSAKVLIGYMTDGEVRHEGSFTNDHEFLDKQLHIPLGEPGISASPYICLSDFVHRWPSNAQVARVVLMITNGVDPYNGSTSVLNQDSPYVDHAISDAQRAGVTVYALYYGDAGIRGGSANFSGQSYLADITESTGGRSLYQGTMNPVDFTPFLNDFRKDLDESYLLAFQANGTHVKPDTLTDLKVKSNTSGVKVHAPSAVHPGLDE